MTVTTKIPLKISIKRVARAGSLPTTRRTFVAPAFPEPDLRISDPVISLVRIKLVGKDPII